MLPISKRCTRALQACGIQNRLRSACGPRYLRDYVFHFRHGWRHTWCREASRRDHEDMASRLAWIRSDDSLSSHSNLWSLADGRTFNQAKTLARFSSVSYMAYTPSKITIAEAEVREAWTCSYSPQTNAEAMSRVAHRPLRERAVMFVARLAFRGIYFPQMRRREWGLLVWRNRRTLLSLSREGLRHARTSRQERPQIERIATNAAMPGGSSGGMRS